MPAGTIATVPDPMRVALATFGVDEFAVLHATCVDSGHVPVVYVNCRSMKPNSSTDADSAAAIGRIVEALPPGIDLLLPGNAAGLADGLAGYRLDLLIVYGFNWKLPAAVLDTPRHGVLNVHTSMLPKYRGPAPVLWAIRNGDPETGLTIHRMDERFDTGQRARPRPQEAASGSQCRCHARDQGHTIVARNGRAHRNHARQAQRLIWHGGHLTRNALVRRQQP
jgi:hypothetical protein